jgi:hypothetical protein
VRSVFVVSLLAALAVSSYAGVASADKRTEATAKAAARKAEDDFLRQNYADGYARLDKALKACGTTKCGVGTRAALLRDMGALAFRNGQKDRAAKHFADALALQPNTTLNPNYDAPDLRSAFAAAAKRGGAGGEAGGVSAPPAGGDFTHTPPTEQRTDTPLPIYVEGGGDVASAAVRYKPAGASSWKRMNLKKMGDGWGGLIPCADVQVGTLQYYVQGFNAAKDPVANNGDPSQPYSVAIQDEISGDAPHLPGKDPPKKCHASSDCPPDFPGCAKNDGATGDSETGSSDDSGDKEAKPKKPYKTLWFGIAGALDFQPMPSGHNLCHLVPQPEPTPPNAVVPNAGTPNNSENVYCTNLDGTDFPSRANQNQNSLLVPGSAGESGGGIQRGEARIMVSFDYALSPNLLVGARLGFSLFVYPGEAAYNEGHAYRFAGSRLYWDARGTYVFGGGVTSTIAPMIFAGLGMASFDTSTSSQITLSDGSGGTVNMWQNNGPFFILLGGGLHYMITDSLGGTIGLRVNGSFGTNGFVPTFGPELGLQYGF